MSISELLLAYRRLLDKASELGYDWYDLTEHIPEKAVRERQPADDVPVLTVGSPKERERFNELVGKCGEILQTETKKETVFAALEFVKRCYCPMEVDDEEEIENPDKVGFEVAKVPPLQREIPLVFHKDNPELKEFNEKVDALQKVFKTDNLTSTVLESVRFTFGRKIA